MIPQQSAPRDFDIGVARRLSELEKQLDYLRSIILNPGISQGTWTPAFTGTTIAGVFTYDTQLGFYNRIGDLVFVFARINITGYPTPPTGALTITGLPFTCKQDGNIVTGLALGMVSQFNLSVGSLGLTLRVTNNTTTISIMEYFDNAGAANFPAAGLNATAQIIFSGVYRAA